MQWIKASERLPDSYDAHEKHVRLKGKKINGCFIEGAHGGLVFEYREPVGGYRIIKDLSEVEWLDESPDTSLADRLEELNPYPEPDQKDEGYNEAVSQLRKLLNEK